MRQVDFFHYIWVLLFAARYLSKSVYTIICAFLYSQGIIVFIQLFPKQSVTNKIPFVAKCSWCPPYVLHYALVKS
jgi:hypothetical protein